MNIIKMKVEDLIPYINNPRNNENAVDKVASSIAEFGFQNPIIVNKNNVVLAGHTRLLASKKMGLEEVPCIVTDLSEVKEKAFRIADNKVSEYSSWDNELLNIELEQLEELNFNMEIFGVSVFEPIEFEIDEDIEDLLEEEYEEPPKKTCTCPNCGHIDSVERFK